MGQASSSRIFLAVLLVASASLAGCGRRGPLELPPGSPQPANQNTSALADKQDTALNQSGPSGVIQSPNVIVQTDQTSGQLAAKPPARPINAPPQAKPTTFFLDPLL